MKSGITTVAEREATNALLLASDDDSELAVFRSYGEEITVLQGLDLDLCSRWSAQTGMPINMDALFALCFVEDIETSNRAMQYFGSLLQRGTPWLCSYDTLLQVLLTFGVAPQLSTLCEEYNKQESSSKSFEEPQVRPRLYLCNDAARHMEHVLICVRTCYEMALDRYVPV
jgi:hypothetical protein